MAPLCLPAATLPVVRPLADTVVVNHILLGQLLAGQLAWANWFGFAVWQCLQGSSESWRAKASRKAPFFPAGRYKH